MAWDSGTLVENILKQLAYHDKSVRDVDYVEHERGWCSWTEFVQAFGDYKGDYVAYDKLNSSFAVVGRNLSWWLKLVHNHNCEAYSEWVFYEPIVQPEEHVIPLKADIIDKFK